MLTPDQLREALLGVLTTKGWRDSRFDELWGWHGQPPRGKECEFECKYYSLEEPPYYIAPRYDLDLNLIVEEVGRLEWEQQLEYSVKLEKILDLDGLTQGFARWVVAQAPASLRLWALWQTIQNTGEHNG